MKNPIKSLRAAAAVLLSAVIVSSCSDTATVTSSSSAASDGKISSSTVSYSGKVSEDQMLVKFLNVGEADCAIILMKDFCAMIDTGLPSTAPAVAAELNSMGISRIDAMVITHLDKDHFGGAKDIVEKFDVGRVILGPDDNSSGKIEKMFEAFGEANITPEYPEVGDKIKFGRAEFEILAPYGKNYKQENDYSLVGKLSWQGYSILFAGDCEETSITEMLTENPENLKADVLKIPHHGRHNRMSVPFLNAVSPKYAVISSVPEDADNRVVSALLTMRTQYYITGDGTVTMNITPEGIDIG